MSTLNLLSKIVLTNATSAYIGIKSSPKKGTDIEKWYDSLKKPMITPAKWMFAPVWIYLYTSMTMSVYLIEYNGGVLSNTFLGKNINVSLNDKKRIKFIYYTHLFLNFIWTPIFFGKKMVTIGLIDISIVLFMALYMKFEFKKYSKWSSYLLIPYIAWLGLATYLNLFIWIKNPDKR